MKICANCGTHLDDTAVVCTTCGTPATVTEPTAPVVTQPGVSPTDAPCRGFWWLGFLFWYVGLVLFIVFKNKSPQRAKSALKGMIVGLIVYFGSMVVAAILYFLFFISLIGIGMY